MPKPAHLDRLSVTDNSFLLEERGSAHMHIGAVLLFDPPIPSYDDLLAHLERRLQYVPRYRQRVSFPPLGTGRPVWVDDRRFDLGYHVRHTALPAPGGVDALKRLVGRIYSQRLDRSKPLWETWLVEGLEDGRFALISKTHHAMIDGVSGADISTVIFDFGPEPSDVPPEDPPWVPGPEPTPQDLALRTVRAAAGLPARLFDRAVTAVRQPGETMEQVREAAAGLGEVALQFADPAPQVPLNVPIGPHRKVEWVPGDLDDYKAIKKAFGGTINDVVLTVTAAALGRWLRHRGVRTEGLELRALVPVSTRTAEKGGALGNELTVMRGPLPVGLEDPVERLAAVSHAMRGLKESRQAVGAEALIGLQTFAPPTLLAQASRLNFSTRLFNLIVTNVPGPQFPLYLLGAKLSELIPVAFLPTDHTLAVAIMSYHGGLTFGLLGDADALADLDLLAGYFTAAHDELLALI